MDIKTVAVRLTAYNSDYKKAMKESGDSVSAFSKVTTAALAAAAVAAVGFAMKAADGYVSWGKTIMGLSRVSGEGVETMSKWNFAAQQSGVSSEALGNGIKFLQKSMAANNDEFAKLGVTTRNDDGTYRSVHAVFLDTADAISKMSNATEKADAIRQIFGRNGQALGALLNKGRDGIIALEAEATKYGLVLTQDNVPAIQANIKAHRAWDAAMQGASNQIGQSVLPMLTSATEFFAKLPGPIASSIAPLGGLVIGVGLLSKAMAGMGLSLGPWGAVIALIGTGAMLIKNRVDEGTKSVESLTESVRGTVAGAKSMEDLNRIQASTVEQMKGLKQAADDVHAPWDVFYKKDLRDGTAALQTTAIAQSILKAEVEQYAKANGVSNDVALQHIQLQRQQAKRVAETGEATKATAEEVKALTEANKAENDALRAQFDPLFGMLDATNKLGEAKQKAKEQEWAVVAALNNYNQAVLIYGQNSAAATDALWKLNDAKAAQATAGDNVVRASLDEQVAINNLETAFKINGKSLEENQATLRDWVAQGRITQDQADHVNYRFWLMKAKADELSGTRIIMGVDVNASTFFAKLTDIWNALDATKVKIDKNWGAGGIAGIGVAIGNAHHSAGGAPLSDGWNIINEEGPEALYKQGSQVAVMTAGQTRRMLTPANAGASGRAPEVHTHYHTHEISFPNYVGDKRDLMDVVNDQLRTDGRAREGTR